MSMNLPELPMIPGGNPSTPRSYSLALSLEGPKRADPEENQDACLACSADQLGIHLVAVADGHGSSPHDRSDIGSQKAVDCVDTVIRDWLLENSSALTNISRFVEFKEWWEDSFFSILHESWIKEIDRDIEEQVRENKPTFPSPSSASGSAMDDLRIKYGTTLLVTLSCGSVVAFGQVGDGLTIVSGGQKVNFPLVKPGEDLDDTRNATDSLCNEQPSAVFKAIKGTKPPRLVVLCTDGIDDGFVSISSVKKWILDISRSEYLDDREQLRSKLKEFLRSVSSNSGDDATVGVIYSPEGDRPPQVAVEQVEVNEVTSEGAMVSTGDLSETREQPPDLSRPDRAAGGEGETADRTTTSDGWQPSNREADGAEPENENRTDPEIEPAGDEPGRTDQQSGSPDDQKAPVDSRRRASSEDPHNSPAAPDQSGS
jgi:serine/threonine protein phosphatase PrpC